MPEFTVRLEQEITAKNSMGAAKKFYEQLKDSMDGLELEIENEIGDIETITLEEQITSEEIIEYVPYKANYR